MSIPNERRRFSPVMSMRARVMFSSAGRYPSEWSAVSSVHELEKYAIKDRSVKTSVSCFLVIFGMSREAVGRLQTFLSITDLVSKHSWSIGGVAGKLIDTDNVNCFSILPNFWQKTQWNQELISRFQFNARRFQYVPNILKTSQFTYDRVFTSYSSLSSCIAACRLEPTRIERSLLERRAIFRKAPGNRMPLWISSQRLVSFIQQLLPIAAWGSQLYQSFMHWRVSFIMK